MSGSVGYINAFLSNTLAFCQTNIVLPPSDCSDDPIVKSGKFTMKLNKLEGTATHATGTGGVYTIDKPSAFNGGLPSFEMYFCYYGDDKIFQTFISDQASVMFTPKMNGCTFVVGSATQDGGRLIAHANVSMTSNTEKGAQEQELNTYVKVITNFTNPEFEILQRGDYRPWGSDNAGTTFGVRDPVNGQWRFYVQRWERLGPGNYKLLEVKHFAG